MQPAVLGLSPSFGFGDRIGLATSGHVLALNRAGAGIAPIFAQQSIREMTRANRTPQQVMADALEGAKHAGYEGVQGADADHLKTAADVDRTAEAGFVFFTIDPSDHVDKAADTYDAGELERRYRSAQNIGWISQYQGKSIKLSTGTTIQIMPPIAQRAAVKYGQAVSFAIELSRHIGAVMGKRGQAYEIELSVDETPQPTTLAEHYIVAHRCLSQGMKLVSLAPRFIGDFEKGVDFKGDVQALEKSLGDHAAIATMVGPYKLSLHSGSDKLSVYEPLARHTKGRFHVKTAGTSYLEALRVVARHDEPLFRRIVDFSRSRYDADKATYHVSATLSSAPPQERVGDIKTLEKLYLENWSDVLAGKGFTAPGRQILHCTFGSVLTDSTLKSELIGMLKSHRSTYDELLAEHFGRHLAALKAGI